MGGPKFKNPEDKASYTNSLKAFFGILIQKGLAPDTYQNITENNYDAANDFLQNLINNKSIMLPSMNKLEGTTPLQFIDKMMELAPENSENLSREKLANDPNNWFFLYDYTYNAYNGFTIAGTDKVGIYWQLHNANVWRSLDAVRETIHNLDVELEGTKRPWSSDSDDFKAVKKNLSELSKKLKEKTAFIVNKDGRLVAHDYSFNEMAKDFESLMSSIGDYRASHQDDTLSDRQVERLQIMSRVSTAYDNVRLAGVKLSDGKGKLPELTSKGFKEQDIVDNICLTKLKLWNKEFYKTALRNRAFFNDLRTRMISDPSFKKDLKELKPEGLAKLTEAELKEKFYFTLESADLKPSELSSIEQQVLYQIHDSFEKKSALAKIASENDEANLQDNPIKEKIAYRYGVNSRRLLQAYAIDREIKGTGEDGKIEYDDFRDIHRAFMKELKSGSLLVFDRNGKKADSLDALQVLVDRMNHPDGRPAFFRYDTSASAYVAQNIVFDVAKSDTALKIFAFQGDPNKKISKDYFMVCDAVIKEVRDLRKDLYEARSFWHSKEHNAMSDALDKICEKFDSIDFSKCDPKTMQDAFVELTDAADKYAESHVYDAGAHSLNDKQVDRLIVAQKIRSINDSLKHPDMTYKDYLVNKFAKKITLDLVRVTDAEWKKVKDQTIDKNKDPKGYLERERIVASDQSYKADLTTNHNREYLGRSPKEWLNDKVFKNITKAAPISYLEEALKWTPERTAQVLGVDVLDNKPTNKWVKSEAEKIMKKHPDFTAEKLGVEDLFDKDELSKAQQSQGMTK